MAKATNMSMNDRLKSARKAAGFPTATSAIDHFNWKPSSYRAHENGQNNFKVDDAVKYGKAYGVTAAWLLIGATIASPSDEIKTLPSSKVVKDSSLSSSLNKLEAIFVLLKDDPRNSYYVEKLREGVITYSQLLQRK
jgi:hypothetical protein